jgi:DNA-binding MarR family transcriptional regulator
MRARGVVTVVDNSRQSSAEVTIDRHIRLAREAERARVVELARNPDDRRIVQLLLTPRGRSAIDLAHRDQQMWTARLLLGLDLARLLTATHAVRVIRHRLVREEHERREERSGRRDRG